MAKGMGMTLVSKVNRDANYKTSSMIISKAGTVLVIDPYRIPAQTEAGLIHFTKARNSTPPGPGRWCCWAAFPRNSGLPVNIPR
jgi:hypothetical protein